MMAQLTISEINNLRHDEFIKIFGNVVEHYPKVAIEIADNKPFTCRADISDAVNVYLDKLPLNEKESILQLHPDLAGKLADLGKLTAESSEEQKSADLHLLSTGDKLKLNQLNNEYKEKFGFPFVICARENKTQTILISIEQRLKNTKEQELAAGIEEVKNISKLRILQIIKQ